MDWEMLRPKERKTLNSNQPAGSRRQKSKMKTDKAWFKEKLRDIGKSQRALGRHIGMDSASISHLMNGMRKPQIDEVPQIANFLGVRANEVLRAFGVFFEEDHHRMVPIVGIVDGNGRIELFPETRDEIEAPTSLPSSTCVITAQTLGSALDPLDGSRIFYLPTDKIEPAAVGRLSVVETETGELLIRGVRRGTSFDSFRLVGFGVVEDERRLRTAAPIYLIKP